MIEDGTFVVTDGQGRYSFYGLVNRTHSLKVDATTLPAGAKLVPIGTRNLGDGGSLIVDLKAGGMHRGDFAIAGCEGPIADELRARAKALEGGVDPLAALAGAQLSTDARAVPDVKALPASGIVGAPGQPGGAPALDAPAGSSRVTPYASVLEVPAATRPTPSPNLPLTAMGQPAEPLEQLVPGLDKEPGFIGLKDGDTLPFAQAAIRVKGTAGAALKLSVNGIEIPETRIGKRSTLAETQVQALEYIGVELKAGTNELSVSQLDQFGNPRGSTTIRVNAPGRAGKLVIELPQAGAIADGKTYARVVVKVLDENGAPVTSRTPVTLASSVGLWKVDDSDPAEPGVQTFVEGGQAQFPLAPPLEPGSTQIVVTSGKLRAETRLDFLPELRSLIATGVIEGVVNMRNINSRALVPTRATDDFEQELRQFSRDWNDGKTAAGARAAFFLKGKIKGDYLLTAAYDSDKDTRERLFRDIQPDEFYPVYGDSAVRGYDAQSTSKLYVRIDKDRSYLLWGDFTTQVAGDVRRLSNYSRSITGVKGHYENERVSANAFASRDTTRQVIEELRANGTSGPYQLSTLGALVNSEKVEIITRDRNQSSVVLASLAQARFIDYEIEPLTGRILFRSPVASVDRDLNPVFVRVTYEVDQGGQEFWVAGVDAQVKLGERVEVGGTYVKDDNPVMPFTLAGANAVVKLGESTYVMGEVARTENGTQGVKGDASRLEVRHESKDLKAQAFIARSDPEFNNPGAWLSNGRAEAGGRAEYRIREGTQFRAEALRTEDVATGAVRDGALAAITQEVAKNFTLELGMRYAAEKGTPPSPILPVPGSPPPEPLPDQVTTVRARLTGQVPYIEGASLYGEAEVDVNDTDRRILAAGGEFALPNRGRLYARHEFISSITGPYGLNATERQNTTAVGVDFDYMQDGRLFSEYRIRDAMSGGDAEAAVGLRNLWTLAPGLRLGTSIERVHALSGTGQNENTAGAIALEYTANPLWKGTTRLELRDASTTESLLFTVGLAAKINRDWTALLRNAYSLQRAKDGGNERVVERMQAGLAWRDTETNQWNALGRIEHRLDQDDTQVGIQLKTTTTIVSLHADWQPRRPFLVSGRYAAKWTDDKSNGLASKYRAQVVGGRFTWEFAPKWDIGFVTSLLVGESFDSRQYGVGLELGYLVTTNLWVSGGYNFFGYRDADLSGADYTTKGPYVRLRYKFDEQVLESWGAGQAKTVAAGECRSGGPGRDEAPRTHPRLARGPPGVGAGGIRRAGAHGGVRPGLSACSSKTLETFSFATWTAGTLGADHLHLGKHPDHLPVGSEPSRGGLPEQPRRPANPRPGAVRRHQQLAGPSPHGRDRELPPFEPDGPIQPVGQQLRYTAVDIDFQTGNWQDAASSQRGPSMAWRTRTRPRWCRIRRRDYTVAIPTVTATTSANCAATDTACNVRIDFNTSLVTFSTMEFRSGPSHSGAGQGAGWNTFQWCAPRPTLTKAFSPTTVGVGQNSVLTFTITSAAGATARTGLTFTDTLPAGLVIASPNGATTTCGGSPTFTATPGTGAFTVGGTGVNAAAGASSCTVSVNVTGNTAGSYVNGAAQVTAIAGMANGVTNQTLNVRQASLNKTFAPTTIDQGGTSTLTFTLTNGVGNPAQSGIDFTDTLPANVVVAATPNITSSCPSGTGVVTATAGSGSIVVAGATMNAAQASCTITVDVTSNVVGGPYNNTSGSISGTARVTNGVSTSGLTVRALPTLTKAFSPTTVGVGQNSVLTFTVTNPAGAIARTGLTFTDALPAGAIIGTPNGVVNGCGGTPTITATPGGARSR